MQWASEQEADRLACAQKALVDAHHAQPGAQEVTAIQHVGFVPDIQGPTYICQPCSLPHVFIQVDHEAMAALPGGVPVRLRHRFEFDYYQERYWIVFGQCARCGALLWGATVRMR